MDRGNGRSMKSTPDEPVDIESSTVFGAIEEAGDDQAADGVPPARQGSARYALGVDGLTLVTLDPRRSRRDPFLSARREARGQEKRLGELLIELGFLKPEDLARILDMQINLGPERPRQRFGAIARELGLVTAWQVDLALARQFHLPALAPSSPIHAPELLAAYQPNHSVVEVLRGVRERICQTWLDVKRPRAAGGSGPSAGGNAIAIVSAQRGEGRSFITANLAITFAQCGRRTLLVDADLRHPRQHELFRVDGRVGLSTLLAGRSGADSVTHIVAMRDLYVMRAGPIPPNSQDLLARPEFGRLLAIAEEQFDVVLVDTPAWTDGPDAETVCRRTRAAALVVRANQTAAAAAQDFVATLRAAQCQMLGLVFNR
jgi:receptor protein-tyrosine kinase